MTPFEKLGLLPDATVSQVKDKYFELAKTLHPDHGGDAVKFHEMHLAYNAALAIASKPKICQPCGGRGKTTIRKGFATMDLMCQVCRGTGRARG